MKCRSFDKALRDQNNALLNQAAKTKKERIFAKEKKQKKSKSCNEEKWGFAIINKRQAKKICTSVDFQQKENFKQW